MPRLSSITYVAVPGCLRRSGEHFREHCSARTVDPATGSSLVPQSAQPMSKPERVVLVLSILGVFALMVMMMVRALDFQSQLSASANDQEFEEARTPLPAGPRKFQ